MSTYTLKLHIESPGTKYTHEDGTVTSSPAGHAWFEVISPEGISAQSGFGPDVAKSDMSSVQGHVLGNDGEAYSGSPAFTAIYAITQEQAATLGTFRQDPKQFGFNKDSYHALTNSCVDFVWKALETIGMNPLKRQGEIYPMDNADDFLKLRNPAISAKPAQSDKIDPPISLFQDPLSLLPNLDPYPVNAWTPMLPGGSIIVSPLEAPVPIPVMALGGRRFVPGDCFLWDAVNPSRDLDPSDHRACQIYAGH